MLSVPEASPLAVRRNCSKNGTMAAGFSIGIPAVRSSIPDTSSLAFARAFALTGGAFGTRLLFFADFFFFAPAVWPAAFWEWKKNGPVARSIRAEAARSHCIDLLYGEFLLHAPHLELAIAVEQRLV